MFVIQPKRHQCSDNQDEQKKPPCALLIHHADSIAGHHARVLKSLQDSWIRGESPSPIAAVITDSA
jgi:hypothetical protein